MLSGEVFETDDYLVDLNRGNDAVVPINEFSRSIGC